MNPGIMEKVAEPLAMSVPRTSTGALAEKAKASRVIIGLREFGKLALYVRNKGCPKPLCEFWVSVTRGVRLFTKNVADC